MAISEVQKVQIITLDSVRDDVLSSLQEKGIIQVEEVDRSAGGLACPAESVSQLDHRLHRLKHVISGLGRWEEKGFLEKILREKPSLAGADRQNALAFDSGPVLERFESIEGKQSELFSEIRFLEREIEFLSRLEALDLPVADVGTTDSTETLIGTCPLARMEDLQGLEEQGVWIKTISQEKRTGVVLLLFLKKERETVVEKMREVGFNVLYFSEPVLKRALAKDHVSDVIERIQAEVEEKRSGIEELDRQAGELFVHRENLMCVYDVLLNERERLCALRMLGETGRTTYLEGWVCTADVKKLKDALKRYSDLVQVYLRPPLPDEEAPVVLNNPKPVRPFEIITKLYGLPQRGSFDPTVSLTPFFFIFVGLTVSEAGYGLLVTLLALLYWKLAKPKGGALQFLKLMIYLGVANIILGTLLGGWFGFPFRKLMIIDPLEDSLTFLALALLLGFIQVWYGTFLNMLGALRRREYLAAIFVQGGWLLLLPALILYIILKKDVFGILSLAGAAGVVFFAAPSRNPLARFFGGLYSLYDISKYLGDILSYSRLLALGLATGVIAMVVNTLCQTALGIPYLGWLLAALIFVGGHLFNLAISFLGGFVHSMRLQFVEFFSKFFRPGGKPFKPLALESEYVEFL